MLSLVEILSAHLQCCPHELAGRLQNPEVIKRAKSFLRGKKLQTTHLGVRNKHVMFGNISRKDVTQVKAYRGFLGVTVVQHYYCRHRFLLRYQTLPCIMMYHRNGSISYFPFEVLTLA